MSDFIRPELLRSLRRWREVIAAALLIALGLWWGVTSFGVLRWLGVAIAICGLALAYAGSQRLRFNPGGGGPGVVTVDEARLVYYGPETGGVADLDLLHRLELDPAAPPGASWVLTMETGEVLTVPVNAEGADRLFDLFARLPGLRSEAVVNALSHRPSDAVTLWQAPPRRLH
ncbi:hypothetical protein [Histidinibacterium aquaticum]|uniref:Uncharacterized protein n=1 Tax=Histidinibacterium aquaticum TaxID=2613962 RepID=A0A5J5GSJ8_9RHOB|nr:hypothetical protein [Histidinibacterium aquaticum]KAA9010568.1 hypothetical protein F3S47_04840 [Histidinibacterium aquaticum]